uniref:Uncharacterized protein n=1 Tax=Romanomermis culicivorax TaxID=13658 RepID=A0A915I3U0_ROMCU
MMATDDDSGARAGFYTPALGLVPELCEAGHGFYQVPLKKYYILTVLFSLHTSYTKEQGLKMHLNEKGKKKNKEKRKEKETEKK